MTRRIASLGMYDHGPQQAANDRLWREIARILSARGISGVPRDLERSRSLSAVLHDPAMLFGQVCGYPLVTETTLALRVLGTPVYDVPGAQGGVHRSFLVARHDDAATLDAYRDRRAAINGFDSNTGMNLLRATIAPIAAGGRFFASVTETGSHRASIAAIVRGDADIAAIDSVTFAAVQRDAPDATAALRILASTTESATPPFVTARATPIETVAALRVALAQVAEDPGLAETRATLFLTGITSGGTERYAPIRALEIDAVVAGYPELR
ncbi:PhnD/SsuA/transferrin family substrate-binding protein [Sphingomonas sp. RB3P16]|uniref:phosphate/phosphite/phosphonate ABC transporter substrate-binding protein n=1 Tax=Parasphingomonas frigoris TaxID=3096163 RepID=UPI002FCBD4C9